VPGGAAARTEEPADERTLAGALAVHMQPVVDNALVCRQLVEERRKVEHIAVVAGAPVRTGVGEHTEAEEEAEVSTAVAAELNTAALVVLVG
jgi:hypothetical protein